MAIIIFTIAIGTLAVLAIIDNYKNPPHGGLGAMG